MRKSLLALLLLPALALAGCGGHRGAPGPTTAPLKVGVIPYEGTDAITTQYTPFARYLGQRMHRTGEVFVTPDYAGVLTALRADQIDCAYLNPLSYVLAVQEYRNTPEHLIPLAMPYFDHSLTYKGIIFVRADSGIHTLQDLRGKRIAFNDRTSTSGYLYPAQLLMKAGVDPNKDVTPVNITGTAGVLAVLGGQADAGAGFEGVIQLALAARHESPAQQAAQAKQLRVIAYTAPIPNGMIVARGNLDPATLASLQDSLTRINKTPNGQRALAAIPWNKVVPPQDAIFDPVRQEAKMLGLNLRSLDQK